MMGAKGKWKKIETLVFALKEQGFSFQILRLDKQYRLIIYRDEYQLCDVILQSLSDIIEVLRLAYSLTR